MIIVDLWSQAIETYSKAAEASPMFGLQRRANPSASKNGVFTIWTLKEEFQALNMQINLLFQ
jgi:hypothetical protein